MRTETDKIKKLIKSIRNRRNIIAEHRDKLRDDIDELEMICESVEGSVEELDSGLRQLEAAADTLSQFL